MAVRRPSAGAPHERTQLLVVVSIPADDDDLHVWQVRVRSKATKPRNMPYPSEGLTFHGGEGAVVVDMLNEKLVWSLSSSSLPGPTKIVYGQLQHGRATCFKTPALGYKCVKKVSLHWN